MNLILLGAPGAGKGTQGALLTERHGFSRIATGDLLRSAVREGTELGRKAKGYMDAGELVPDEIIFGLVRETLERRSDASGIIFDGFPRNLEQAEELDRILADAGRPLDAVVVIEVPDDILVKRISGRRSCAECGAVYNIYFDAPTKPGRCNECGGALTERADDDAETVRRRLEVYRERTAPLIRHYTESDAPVHTVDGDRDVEDVYREIERALDL